MLEAGVPQQLVRFDKTIGDAAASKLNTVSSLNKRQAGELINGLRAAGP